MTVAVASRLPGLSFQSVPPPSPRVLPRMDVAAFVGFAARGPFDLPVAIEDADHYAAVFGDDLQLAIDPITSEGASTQLGSAVRTFLRNGGTRCWVTRVGAMAAATVTRFPIPGLLGLTEDGLTPISLPARSPGSWADEFSMATALDSVATALVDVVSGTPDSFDLRLATAGSIVAGDLLRISDKGWNVLVPTQPAAGATGSPPELPAPGVTRIGFDRSRAMWIEPLAADAVANPPWATGEIPPVGTSLSAQFTASDGTWHVPVAASVEAPPDAFGRLKVDLSVSPEAAPAPGTLVRIGGAGTRDLWLAIDSLGEPGRPAGSPPQPDGVAVVGAAWWVSTELPPGPVPASPETTTVEVVALELWARSPGQPDARLTGLGLTPEHTRWFGALPSDDALYALAPGSAVPVLWSDAGTAGMPLAGDGDGGGLEASFPLGIAVVPGAFLDAPAPAADVPTRNGILSGSADAFVDADLADSPLGSLAATADFIAYQQPQPRRLRGLHSVMALNEVTLMAIPDAAQRQWAPAVRAPLGPVTAPTQVSGIDVDGFAPCGAGRLDAPVLEATAPDAAGRATVIWDPVGADLQYLVQGSADPAQFSDAVELYDGIDTSLSVDVARTGPYFRVRAHSATGAGSDWSNGVAIDFAPPASNLISSSYDAGPLLAIQRAALRMCAARGDVLAVLSLPIDYREDDAINHASQLRSAYGAGLAPSTVPPLDGSETAALTYGMLYHPWPIVQLGMGAALGRVVPDGPALGVFAERSIKRGAWVAAADEPLNDVVGLEPAIAAGRLGDLQAGRVNIVRQAPGAFVCLDQDTLSLEDDLRPANVRRLLALLRRLVALYAPAHVFAVNDARLRRRIQRGFEANLLTMYTLGAFTGDTASQAFQVVTGTPPNTPQTADQGQLIVELRVAPSLPMRFLTVRLTQGAAGDLQVQEF